MTGLQLYSAHVATCAKCLAHPTGMCPTGFALLDAASGMRNEPPQQELFRFVELEEVAQPVRPHIHFNPGEGWGPRKT